MAKASTIGYVNIKARISAIVFWHLTARNAGQSLTTQSMNELTRLLIQARHIVTLASANHSSYYKEKKVRIVAYGMTVYHMIGPVYDAIGIVSALRATHP